MAIVDVIRTQWCWTLISGDRQRRTEEGIMEPARPQRHGTGRKEGDTPRHGDVPN